MSDNEITRIAGKRGKLPAKKLDMGTLKDYLTAPLPNPPQTFDYAPRVSGGFPMALNDTYGDCTIAGVVHLLQLMYAEVGQTFTYPGDTVVKSTYFGLTGGQDTGCVETDVLQAWQSDGLFGTKIAAFASIDITDWKLMAQAAYAFGGLYFGVELPANAETQFENHEPWDLVPGNNPPVGGHCITGSGLTLLSCDIETWGDETAFSKAWWGAYGSECYIAIPELFVQVGHGPLANLDIKTLQADIASL